jgi:hypothetical protein
MHPKDYIKLRYSFYSIYSHLLNNNYVYVLIYACLIVILTYKISYPY